jgi:type II secretory pathway component PulF
LTSSQPNLSRTVSAAAWWHCTVRQWKKAAAKTLSAEERNVLTARIAALLDQNQRLVRQLALARRERDTLERALNAIERNQKRELDNEAE